MKREQLQEIGLSAAGIARWVAGKRLHRVHPGVYAVGHAGIGTMGRMAAALFYAGPGAMLSHLTAAWWWRLLEVHEGPIHVTAPARRRSLPEVRIHRSRREIERVSHRRLPVSSPADTLLDIAPAIEFKRLRQALGEAQFLRIVSLETVAAALRRGKAGSAALRRALESHLPQLARTRSQLEIEFLLLCERHSLPLPEVNVRIAGWVVDAVWREHRIGVELDSRLAHEAPWTLERDHRRDVDLRAAGYTPLRYTWAQLTGEPERVASDLRRSFAARA